MGVVAVNAGTQMLPQSSVVTHCSVFAALSQEALIAGLDLILAGCWHDALSGWLTICGPCPGPMRDVLLVGLAGRWTSVQLVTGSPLLDTTLKEGHSQI